MVLDAGHGGHDRGGVPGQRYSEKIYTLDIAQRVRTKLRAAGYTQPMATVEQGVASYVDWLLGNG